MKDICSVVQDPRINREKAYLQEMPQPSSVAMSGMQQPLLVTACHKVSSIQKSCQTFTGDPIIIKHANHQLGASARTLASHLQLLQIMVP